MESFWHLNKSEYGELFLFCETYTQANSKVGSLDTLGILILIYSGINLLLDFIYLIYSILIMKKECNVNRIGVV